MESEQLNYQQLAQALTRNAQPIAIMLIYRKLVF